MVSTASFPSLDSPVSDFSETLSKVRQDLYYCDSNFKQPRTKDLRANIHAASYVYVAAAMEKCVGSILVAVIGEISSASISLNDLKVSLFALVESSNFESLQQVRGLKMWKKREEIFSRLHQVSACSLSDAYIPLDGRTIRGDHLETIWQIFKFPGNPVPTPIHSMALRDLADARNRVAHGEEKASSVAGEKSITDTLKMYTKIEEVVINLWNCSTQYLTDRDYLR